MAVNNGENVVFDRELRKFDHCDEILINCDRLSNWNDFEQVLLHEASDKTNHRRELLYRASRIVLCNKKDLKIADTIKLRNCKTVHVGNQVSVLEQIVLKDETRHTLSENQVFPKDGIVERQFWLAKPRVSIPDPFKKPVKYVIIAHTATDQYQTQIDNVAKMQLIQKFHMESMGWADIGYNFCIGSDGNAYEGRGWFNQGSHTLGYNTCSIGIAFIGCFLSKLPPKSALDRCRALIAQGVEIGAVRPDYELIGQCQCRPFLSPGPKLQEELSTWEHFNPNIRNTDPCFVS